MALKLHIRKPDGGFEPIRYYGVPYNDAPLRELISQNVSTINAEKNRATQAENKLTQDLTAKVDKVAGSRLMTDAEGNQIKANKDAISALQNNKLDKSTASTTYATKTDLNTEINRATQAEAALGTRIDNFTEKDPEFTKWKNGLTLIAGYNTASVVSNRGVILSPEFKVRNVSGTVTSFGYGNEVSNNFEKAFGSFNKTNPKQRYSIGDGWSDTDRKNLMEIYENGNIRIPNLPNKEADGLGGLQPYLAELAKKSVDISFSPETPVSDKKVNLIPYYYVSCEERLFKVVAYSFKSYSSIVLKVSKGTSISVDVKSGSQKGWALYDLSRTQYKVTTAGNNSVIKETILVEKDGYFCVNNANYPNYSITVTGKFKPVDIMWMERQSILDDIAALKESPKPTETKPLAGKKIVFLGDSAIDVPGKFWTVKCAEILGAEQRTFAGGGCTWAAQMASDGSYGNCMAKRVQELKASGFNPDIIVTQMGGNDLYKTLGTKAEVMKPNYKEYATNETVYGGIRYNIENIIREFPNAILIIGTVFQRQGNKATTVVDALKDMAYEFACPIIDGNSFSGISNRLECTQPYYTDSPTKRPTPEHPIYNWVEPDGSIVAVDAKTSEAVKRYGLYTYDGTHKTAKGEQRMVNFFAAQILNYVKYY